MYCPIVSSNMRVTKTCVVPSVGAVTMRPTTDLILTRAAGCKSSLGTTNQRASARIAYVSSGGQVRPLAELRWYNPVHSLREATR